MKNEALELHVLYVITKLELGGAQKVCLELFKNIQTHGISSTLISGSTGILVDEVSNNPSVYLLDSFKREVTITGLLKEISAFLKLIKVIKKIKKKYPNLIVHTHSTKAGIIGRMAAFFAGVKIRIHTVHGFGFNDHQSKIKWAIIFLSEWFVSFFTTHYICVSKKDLVEGERRIPKFHKKSSIIRAAVNWDSFYIPAKSLVNKKNKSFIFGTVSCFKPQKNLFDLLNAFKDCLLHLGLNYQIKLEIIGDGFQRSGIENWIKKNNLEDYIILHGWQSQVSSFMQKWDCFVLSSLWEGLPCAVVEARLSYLAVIAYSVGGISEIIKDGKNGFLIEVGNYKKLSEKMMKLVLNPTLLDKLSFYKEDLTEFKDAHMVLAHAKLYKTIINHSLQ